ncbi:MAG: SPOR domain-containing protein [Porticoccaceae bacterium]|nr:SPOR domain-containing protein [Porticoccaceae bacterium]
MSNGLKQRIVGALVLGALGLILLPSLFDFADPQRIDRSSLIPPAPEIIAADIPSAQRPAAVADSADVAPVFDIHRLQPVKESDTTYYGLDKSGMPHRWYLQVGSFEERASANKLKESLLAQPYKAFVKTVKLNSKTVHRVYIGPKIDRRRAIADKVKIDKLLATDSLVLKYVP